MRTRQKETMPKFYLERNQIGGIISENTTLEGTIQVMDDVIVEPGVTLQINPGTQITIMGTFKFIINGRLIANGTADERIFFDCFLPENFTMDEQINGWRGIQFENIPAIEETSQISYCVFEHAKGIQEDLRGGAIRTRNVSNLTIENCIFKRNFARFGGAVAFLSHSNVKFVSNIVTKNQALQGGSAIYVYYAYPKIYLNTVIDNTVQLDEEFTKAGAVQFYISKPWFVGNIVRNNTSHFFDLDQIVYYKGYYTNFNNIEAGADGEQNNDFDPGFLLIDDISFTLEETSMCIDTVPVNKIDYYPDNDIFGQTRLYDGNNDGSEHFDYGAFEFNTVSNSHSDEQINKKEVHLTVYPVPFSSKGKNAKLTIKYDLGEEIRNNEAVCISLYDIKGRKLYTQKNIVTTKSGKINFQIVNKDNIKRPSGVYFLKFSALQKSSYRKFLICE